jgi:uncharacterized protein YkwD
VIQLRLVDTRTGARRVVPFESQSMVVGSSIDCDLVLPGADVAAHQCRIEPAHEAVRIVDLGGEHETLLNGRPVGIAELHVGDVLRLGPFQLAVIPTVTTAPPVATAAPPVPDPEPAPAFAAELSPELPAAIESRGAPRPPSFRPAARQGSPAALVGALALVAMLIGAILLYEGMGGTTGRGRDPSPHPSSPPPAEVARAQPPSRASKTPPTKEPAHGAPRSLAETPRDELPEDLPLEKCLHEARTWRTQGEFGKALVVATLVEPKDAWDRQDVADVLASIEAGAQKAADEIGTRVEPLVAEGRLAAALDELEDEKLEKLEGTEAWHRLLERADEIEAALDATPTARVRPRRTHARPREGDLLAINEERDPFRTEPGPDRPSPSREEGAPERRDPERRAPERRDPEPTEPSRAALLLQGQAREQLAAGDFARAKELLELALDGTAPLETRAEIARDHERAKRPLALAARLVELLAAKPLASPSEVAMRDGRRGKLVRSDGERLWVKLEGGGAEPQGVAAAELDARSLLEVSGRVKLTPEESLDRAFLALAAKDDKAFFACLDKATKDPAGGAAKGSVDSALAFQRGLDRVPARGFLRVGERWLTWEEKAAEDLAGEVRETIAAALAGKGEPEKARARVIELAGAAPAVALEQLKRRRGELSRSFLAATDVEKVAKLREKALELQAARKYALDLIFDEARYFYPYAPPACPPEKAAQYPEVQQEVDRRVNAVRAIWGREDGDAPEVHATLTAATVELVRELKLLRGLLDAVGVARDDEDKALVAAWCLPEGARSIGLRSFALDEFERSRLDQDAKILAWNATIVPQDGGPSREELEQILVTNRYRALLGRRVLAYNAKVWAAARKHSDWMSKRGQLSHFEDDPERADPEKRMQLEGYKSGAGENCAVGRSGPKEVLDGWCHSSGHHRNLLFESHTEMGSGQSGTYWTQCFGGGREYKGNLIRD